VSALDRYRAATQRWKDANTARDKAAAGRARAVADMAHDGWDDRTIAHATGLSVPRVQELIRKGETRA
jgi:hypothetical protein